MHRVQKLLSNYGYCSRRKAEELIKAGRVKVNGKLITIGDKASENDKIIVDGKGINKPKKIYLMFNKPVGCVTALKDRNYKTVMDYVKTDDRVFPVGRLDYNTSGLLLLTNDGDFANSIMHPRYEIKKTYLVEIYNSINIKQVNAIEKGMVLEDGKTSPAEVRTHNEKVMEITIHEGKKRVIRRMLKELGLKVKFLERIKIGNLHLGNLGPAKFRPLTKNEKKEIFS